MKGARKVINRIGTARSGQETAFGAADRIGQHTGGANGFAAALRQEMEGRRETAGAQAAVPARTGSAAVNFSRHALARVEERGIELTPGLMEKLSDSVGRAQEKGAKNILAFDTTRAFIINIPYGRVVTAMSREEMRENIFTNIDGAVLL